VSRQRDNGSPHGLLASGRHCDRPAVPTQAEQRCFAAEKATSENEVWLVLINPFSGRGKGFKYISAIERSLKRTRIKYSLVVGEHPGHGIALTQSAIQEGFRNIVAVGGDGTVHEVVNGVFSQRVVSSSEITIAVVPAGTGNDWARSINVSRDRRKALELLRGGRTTLHDVGIARLGPPGQERDRYFINMSGVGFDAFVLQQVGRPKLGSISYVTAMLKGLVRYRAIPLELEVQDEEIRDRMFVLFAGIGRYCGGGLEVTPKARPNDGLIDITAIRDMPQREILFNIRRLFDGTLLQHPRISAFRCSAASIRSPNPVDVEADGELLGTTPVSYSLVPGSIRVVTGN
jgi:diacylglycerol kinase (ATP)